MSDVEQRARDALNAIRTQRGIPTVPVATRIANWSELEAVCRLIEQHDAFRREVSDAVKETFHAIPPGFERAFTDLSRFILPEPVAPITEQLDRILATGTADQMADWLGDNAPAIRAALATVGGEGAK